MKMKYNRLAVGLLVSAALAGQAHAQQAVESPAGEAAAPSGTATTLSGTRTEHLIRILMEKGMLTKQQAQALLLREEAAGDADTRPEVREGDVRVPYVPETVRDEIREDLKQDVLIEAKAGNWATPNAFPDWVSRIKVNADVRVRNESRFFSDGNSNEIIDFAAFNEEGPYDGNVGNTNLILPPTMNTREDETNLLRIKARLGLEAELSDNWNAGIRLATGSSDSPVSTTQTLGGGLNKKDIWLDRAWIGWDSGMWHFSAGRFENPFVSTDILYSGDLNFDGVAGGFSDLKFSNSGSLFATLGAFPLQYGDASWPASSQDKGNAEDRWLLGAQFGADWNFDNQDRFEVAVAYYDFHNIRGERSSPCLLYDGGQNYCDTDWSRPAFMQKGNTVFLLRDVLLNPQDPAFTPEPQYVGPASKFQLVDLNLRWDTTTFSDYKLRLASNVIYNHGYDEEGMWSHSDGEIVNNFDDGGAFKSGRLAWMGHAALGSSFDMTRRGDWNVFFGYKYIEPDALPDAFNDSSFHRGGTNAKGYYLGSAYSLTDRVYLRGRWMSSQEVYGPPLSIDVLQVELNARL